MIPNLKQPLPKATAKRIPVYYRYLTSLSQSGIIRIKSEEFSEMIQIPSATIRRDFSYFGDLGKSGYGYDVQHLLEVFSDILKVDILKKIALVGCGNLGKALIKNNFRRNENLKITCAFDNDPELYDTIVDGVPIYNISQLVEKLKEDNITTAIATVPSQFSQETVDYLVDGGVTSILEFAPGRVHVPSDVHVQYIDLTTELQTLVFFDEYQRTHQK